MPLSHWGRVTHICVGKLTTIGSDNGLSPGRRQAIIWANDGILSIGPLAANFNEILIEIHTFSFKKIHFKMSSGKWRPFWLSLNVLRTRSTFLKILIINTQHLAREGEVHVWGVYCEFEACSVAVIAVPYVISWYIGPRYNGTPLYCAIVIATWARFNIKNVIPCIGNSIIEIRRSPDMPLPWTMSTKVYDAIWRHYATISLSCHTLCKKHQPHI